MKTYDNEIHEAAFIFDLCSELSSDDDTKYLKMMLSVLLCFYFLKLEFLIWIFSASSLVIISVLNVTFQLVDKVQLMEMLGNLSGIISTAACYARSPK